MKSRIFPILNHGIATAGIVSVDDVTNQVEQIFGWLNDDHMSSANDNVCTMRGMHELHRIVG